MNKPRSRLLTCLIGVSAGNGGIAYGDSTLRLFRHTPMCFAHPNSKKTTAFNSGKFTVIAAAFLFSSSSFALDYFWFIAGNPSVGYNSATSACSAYSAGIHGTWPGVDKHWESEKLEATTRPDNFVCSVSASANGSSDGGSGTAWIHLYRMGTSCPAGLVSNPTTGECANDPGKGDPGTCPKAVAGNPINAANGNKFQTEIDASNSKLSTLHFTRTYNSLDGLWRHNHSTYLRLTSFFAAVVMADGRESFFTVSGSTVTASPTELGKLVKVADTWLYTAKNNDTYTFDASGRLTRWTNAAGAEHLLSYVNGTITVTDNLGQSLSFTEDAQHQPLTLSTAGLSIQYDYNANQRLSKLTRTRGGQTEQRLFHYDPDNKNLLTGITDERGVRYTTWTFDAQGRATSSEHAGGVEHTQIVYNSDGSSTVTNEFGKKSIYRFVTIDGVKRVSAIEGEALGSCPMSNSTFTYDARGLLKTKTDNKGFVTTYDYNERGLEITRTVATGTPQARTTTTTWHTSLNLPLTVIEPGRITTYTYDAQGRQLSQTSASTAL
jgi:YD repeat-containing protein